MDERKNSGTAVCKRTGVSWIDAIDPDPIPGKPTEYAEVVGRWLAQLTPEDESSSEHVAQQTILRAVLMLASPHLVFEPRPPKPGLVRRISSRTLRLFNPHRLVPQRFAQRSKTKERSEENKQIFADDPFTSASRRLVTENSRETSRKITSLCAYQIHALHNASHELALSVLKSYDRPRQLSQAQQQVEQLLSYIDQLIMSIDAVCQLADSGLVDTKIHSDLRTWMRAFGALQEVVEKLVQSEESCEEALIIISEIDEDLPLKGQLTDEIVEELLATDIVSPISEVAGHQLDFVAQAGLLIIRDKETLKLVHYMTVTSLMFSPFTRTSLKSWFREQLEVQPGKELVVQCSNAEPFVLAVSGRNDSAMADLNCIKGEIPNWFVVLL